MSYNFVYICPVIIKRNKMKFSKENYKGLEIKKRIDIKSHCCIVYKNGEYIKSISGDIFIDGSDNAIKKAKIYINEITK